jgi:hypothetical protein
VPAGIKHYEPTGGAEGDRNRAMEAGWNPEFSRSLDDASYEERGSMFAGVGR